MRRRRPSSFRVPEQTQSLRWVLSYADFVTLLFAFFVFLYAISSVDEAKFQAFSTTLAKTFDVTTQSVASGEIKPSNPEPFAALYRPPPVDSDPEATDFLALQQQLIASMAELVPLQGVRVQGSADWIEISLPDALLFAPNSIELSIQAESLLDQLVKILAPTPHPIAVEGYADASSVGAEFASNWELSVLRAARVVRFLQNSGVIGERLSAIGFGQYQNQWVGSNPAQHRRVNLMIHRLNPL